MIKYVLMTLLALTILAIIMNGNSKAAMEKCQEKHSYETCFNTLYR